MSKNNKETPNNIEFSIWDTNTEKSRSIPTSNSSETVKQKPLGIEKLKSIT
ncbi:hypothetical protein [Bacillus sp. JJ1562]|uniref:hypothetical protein n=1 Tax=Bacillus sp. JJ1562 TaxID=3122960 RepID=UPI003001B906